MAFIETVTRALRVESAVDNESGPGREVTGPQHGFVLELHGL